MDFSRLKTGQWIAGIGGLLLIISMFLDWYGASVTVAGVEVKGGGGSAFDSPGFLGGIADLLIVAAAFIGIAYLVIVVTNSPVTLPAPASTLTALAGGVATVMVFGRMIFQPGPNEFIELKFGIFFALLMAAAVAVGGYLGMKDEGTTFDDARSQLGGSGSEPGNEPPPPPPSSSSSAPPPGGPPA